MLTHVNVRPRPDNGLPNSSPISSPIPVQVFQQGCHFSLQIPGLGQQTFKYDFVMFNVMQESY